MTTVGDQLVWQSVPKIALTGMLMGVVHVLTGPDHLSALIVLSAGSSWRSCQLGMRWGVGHSVGLIVVTAIFLALHKRFDVDKFGNYCDFGVGILMIALGLWGFGNYWKIRPAVESTSALKNKEQQTATRSQLELEAQAQQQHHHPHTLSSVLRARDGRPEEEPLLGPTEPDAKRICCGLFRRSQANIKDAKTQRITAFMYGIAHGLAGTGGVLGVMPAVILNDWIKSWAYLLSFCAASILTMGAFAATYGELTGRLVGRSDVLLFRVGIFSSCISLVVGVMWVVLVATGKLDDIFG
ncbi:hypothetical protein ATCC90586_009332 [Pythium insidiosum]|nr:hypothetical protein ATCC90586_009332 [Pythium insidiosum]